jgi:hypothetical protein
MAPGKSALDVEVSNHSAIFDPGVNAFDARYRTGVDTNTEITVEGTAHAIDDRGPSMADRTFYSGRAGIRTNPHRNGAAFFAGGGGGYAHSGGAFVAVDSGIAVGYENCYVTPVLQGSAFISQPLAAQPIDVTADSSKPREYDTPATTVGGVARGGLRISLSPSACHRGEDISWISLGWGIMSLADYNSHQLMLGVGAGLEIPL